MQRWRVPLGFACAALFLFFAQPTVGTLIVGAAVALPGLALRAWASGHLRKDEALATSGPYAYTRNPLYLGSAFLAAGFLVAGRSWIGGALVAVYFAVFYYAVVRSEESDIRERFGATFDEYARRVPLFFPRLTRAANGTPSANAFSWAQ